MATTNILFTLLALTAICTIASAQVSQGGPHQNQGGSHQNQGRIRRQIAQQAANVDETGAEQSGDYIPSWTTCSYNATGSNISCADCSTRLICKPVGGLLKVCLNPFKPHCNNGICSPIPSAECTVAN